MKYDSVEIKRIVDPFSRKPFLNGIRIENNFPKEISENTKFLIAIGDNYNRQKMFDQIIKFYGSGVVGSYCSSSAIKLNDEHLPPGAVIMSGAYIGPKTSLSEGILINTGAKVEHDCKLESFSSLAPGAILSGGVRLGRGSHIGTGSIIDAKVNVGANCVIGANSFLMDDLESNSVAVGNPAKSIRPRFLSEPYLK